MGLPKVLEYAATEALPRRVGLSARDIRQVITRVLPLLPRAERRG